MSHDELVQLIPLGAVDSGPHVSPRNENAAIFLDQTTSANERRSLSTHSIASAHTDYFDALDGS